MTHSPNNSPDYLAAYPPALVAQVRQQIDEGRFAPWLLAKYPEAHAIRSDTALYTYVQQLRSTYFRNAGALGRVAFDNRLHVLHQALGTHSRISRVQGDKLKAKAEIRVATVFRDTPEAFLRMIVVHELAHTKEREHDKAFYQLCRHMEPAYHQLEFELRAYLLYVNTSGNALWGTGRIDAA